MDSKSDTETHHLGSMETDSGIISVQLLEFKTSLLEAVEELVNVYSQLKEAIVVLAEAVDMLSRYISQCTKKLKYMLVLKPDIW
uniref:Synaptonemal complex central element protein 2 n=1 Tax=Electrophorus electricus TaxID=8005 RepID=A0AAY5E9Z5_ELEEL